MPKSKSIEQIERLENILAKQKEKELHARYQGKKILGFKLSKGSTESNGKRYVVWRAYACKNAKPIIIHIGVDPRKAIEKIKSYLEKYPERRMR